jgi:Na+-translocating ferredoxin:NAD+ oxidoreductase RnfD subunit
VITGVVAIGVLYFILWLPRLINIILPFRGLFLIGRKLLLLVVPCGMTVVFFGLALLLSLIPSTMRDTLSYALVSGVLLAAEFILALFAAFMLTALLDEGIR